MKISFSGLPQSATVMIRFIKWSCDLLRSTLTLLSYLWCGLRAVKEEENAINLTLTTHMKLKFFLFFFNGEDYCAAVWQSHKVLFIIWHPIRVMKWENFHFISEWLFVGIIRWLNLLLWDLCYYFLYCFRTFWWIFYYHWVVLKVI